MTKICMKHFYKLKRQQNSNRKKMDEMKTLFRKRLSLKRQQLHEEMFKLVIGRGKYNPTNKKTQPTHRLASADTPAQTAAGRGPVRVPLDTAGGKTS